MTAQQLKNSILQMAVQGKLVPQDPNDEPASVLLEKIRKEKERLAQESNIKKGKAKKGSKKKDEKTSVIFRGADNLPYEKIGNKPPVCIADEIPFDIPDSWEWVRLGTIFSTTTGSTPSTKDSSLYGTDFPFYKPADLDSGFNVISSVDTVSKKGYLSGRALSEFSVLVTCIGTLGKTGYIRKKGICNQQINAILPNDNILSEYTYFCICSEFEQQQIRINSSATTLSILNKSKFDNLLFPLPPLAEQHRIVAKIKELFDNIALL